MVLIQMYEHDFSPNLFVYMGMLPNKYAMYFRHNINRIDVFYPQGSTYNLVIESLTDSFTTKVNQCN